MTGTELAKEYDERGYVVIRDAVSHDLIDGLLCNLLSVVEAVSGKRFDSAHSPELAGFLKEDKRTLGKVYDGIRQPPWLAELSMAAGIVAPVKRLLGDRDIALLRKIPFRIDVPLDTTEYAVWHQDYYYVRGNEAIVTAWVPMQDTGYRNGCPKVMPASHRLGPLEHPNKVLGKRDYPSGVFDREVRYVECKKGDVLLFHSCMLHSSSLNLSDAIRFSINARYTRTAEPTDAGMGGILPISA
jgi:ectoine hydroxylase-related dioxygenase (phytanoyl-CoA dioxygenase family)